MKNVDKGGVDRIFWLFIVQKKGVRKKKSKSEKENLKKGEVKFQVDDSWWAYKGGKCN